MHFYPLSFYIFCVYFVKYVNNVNIHNTYKS